MKFQNELQQLRKNANLSQEELAAELDVSRQTISKWEGGIAFPDMLNLIAISEYFHVSVDSMVKETTESINTVQNKENRFHYEYISKKHVGNLPLVHVNLGIGKYTAKGIVAIGNISKGILSIGILSVGVLAIGALSAGLLAMGALSLGILAMGGGAMGVVAAGGIAIGVFSLGGLAIGMVSIGGCSVASHIAIGGYANAPVAIGQIAKGQSILLLDDVGGVSAITSDMVKNLVLTQFPTIPKVFLWFATLFFK